MFPASQHFPAEKLDMVQVMRVSFTTGSVDKTAQDMVLSKLPG